MKPFPIYIGYDPREAVAYHVLSQSILERASMPVAIIPLVQEQLRARGWYTRERGATEATAFSLTRFLVPFLSDYEGQSLFLDCDMLARADIGDVKLYALANPDKAVYVCPHDYTPKDQTKFLGHVQTAYPRKNWSSVMLFNNARCQALTPEYVNSATGAQLHRFQWTTDEQIGSLPLSWNWLIGEYPDNPEAQLWHFTNGGPWFGIEGSDASVQWLRAREAILTTQVGALT